MNTHFKSFFAALLLIGFLSVGLNAAVKVKRETVSFPTAATGQPCQNEVEATLITTRGVECAEVNAETQKVNVKYDPYEISAEQIRNIVLNIDCK